MLNNLKNPLAGPIRFELQPQGKKLWFLRPPTSTSRILEPRPKVLISSILYIGSLKFRDIFLLQHNGIFFWNYCSDLYCEKLFFSGSIEDLFFANIIDHTECNPNIFLMHLRRILNYSYWFYKYVVFCGCCMYVVFYSCFMSSSCLVFQFVKQTDATCFMSTANAISRKWITAPKLIKFGYSEKATTIWSIFHSFFLTKLMTLVAHWFGHVEFQIFVIAFFKPVQLKKAKQIFKIQYV